MFYLNCKPEQSCNRVYDSFTPLSLSFLSFSQVNVGLTVLSLLTFIHPVHVSLYCKKLAKQRKTKEANGHGSAKCWHYQVHQIVNIKGRMCMHGFIHAKALSLLVLVCYVENCTNVCPYLRKLVFCYLAQTSIWSQPLTGWIFGVKCQGHYDITSVLLIVNMIFEKSWGNKQTTFLSQTTGYLK